MQSNDIWKQSDAICVIGAPIGIASSTMGASLGPDAIRLAGLHRHLNQLGYTVVDEGNQSALEETWPPISFQTGSLRYPDEVATFLKILKGRVYAALKKKLIPLVLGGDHSIAVASLAAVGKYYRELGITPGLIWFDAHADLNVPETTPSGNIHGMPLAVALGRGDSRLTSFFEGGFWDPSRSVLLGVRSVDEQEAQIVKDLGIRVFTMKDIDVKGMVTCVREALDTASPNGEPIHVSFDVDGIDAREVPGTGTPVHGGVSYREAHLFLELLAEKEILGSVDMVEVNPLLDHGNKTAEVAVSMLCSAFGKTIF